MKTKIPKRRNIIHRHAKMKSGAGPHNKKLPPACNQCDDLGYLAKEGTVSLICPNCADYDMESD